MIYKTIYIYYIGNISHWLRSMSRLNAGWTRRVLLCGSIGSKLLPGSKWRPPLVHHPNRIGSISHENNIPHERWEVKSSKKGPRIFFPSYIIYHICNVNLQIGQQNCSKFRKPPSRPKVQNLRQLVACVRILRLQLHHGLQVLAKSAEEKWRLSRLN